MFTGRKKKNLSMNVNSWVDSKKIFEDQANILSRDDSKKLKKTTKNSNLSLYPRQDIAVNRFTKYDSDITYPAISHLELGKQIKITEFEKISEKGVLTISSGRFRKNNYIINISNEYVLLWRTNV